MENTADGPRGRACYQGRGNEYERPISASSDQQDVLLSHTWCQRGEQTGLMDSDDRYVDAWRPGPSC